MNESRMVSLVGEAFGVSASGSMHATLHTQHSAAVFIGLDSDVTVEEAGAELSGRVVIAPPDVPRAVRCDGPVVGMIFDPELLPHVASFARRQRGTAAGRLRERLLGAARAHRATIEQRGTLDGLAREVSWALRGEPRPRIDRRVHHALAELRAPGAELRAIVAACGVSEAHLQALFARDVGTTMRGYRLWQRMLHAVVSLRAVDATTAAIDAGFADLAHFSRTCRRMLGHSPSEMRAGLTASRISR